MQKFSRSFLLCFLIFVVSGCSTIPGTRHPSTSAADAQFAADPLEASLDNLRAYVISKQLDRSYWSAPLTSDVTSEALMLAVGIRMGKMNRELRDSYVQSMSDRMEPGREGWPVVPGGKPDFGVTSISLLFLKAAGISPDDARFRNAWDWFESQGGENKIPMYTWLMLSTFNLAPKDKIFKLTPKVFSSSSLFPMRFDRESFLREIFVPAIALQYLQSLPDRALILYKRTKEDWRKQPVNFALPAAEDSMNDGSRKCIIPEEDIDSFFDKVAANPEPYKDCRFYPQGHGTNFFRKVSEFFVKSMTQRSRSAMNFVIDHSVTGTKVYWIKQALSLELQYLNPHGSWYTLGASVIAMRMLQEAQRTGLGDFQGEIDTAWKTLLNMRMKNQDDELVQTLVRTGVWDTSSMLLAFDPLRDTRWALTEEESGRTVRWLLAHAIGDSKTGWSFDETDTTLADVDTTAMTMAMLNVYMPDADPAKQPILEKSISWIKDHQNPDGGFPAWSTTMSPLVANMLNMTVMQTLADFSQADITGRVILAYSRLPGFAKELEQSHERACNFITDHMPKMKGSKLKLAPGNWMVNYVYSAATAVTGLVNASCGPAKQRELMKFVSSTQQEDGGWGESIESYEQSKYVPARSTIMQSAVALASLIAYFEAQLNAGIVPDPRLRLQIEKGITFLIERSKWGTHPIDEEYSGVLVMGMTYARYELAPAYLTLYNLGRWLHLRNRSVENLPRPFSGPARWTSNGLCIRSTGNSAEILSVEAAKKNGGCPQNKDKSIEETYRSFQYSAAVGSIVVTSTHHKFQRYRNPSGALGWQDLSEGPTRGLVLYDFKPEKKVNHREAEAFCQQYGLQLPSGYPKSMNGQYNLPDEDSDLVALENHHVREVLRDLNNEWLSSRTRHPGVSESASKHPPPYEDSDYEFAYGFGGRIGTIFTVHRSFRMSGFSARCVDVLP